LFQVAEVRLLQYLSNIFSSKKNHGKEHSAASPPPKLLRTYGWSTAALIW
jgi:hypothetical protein